MKNRLLGLILIKLVTLIFCLGVSIIVAIYDCGHNMFWLLPLNFLVSLCYIPLFINLKINIKQYRKI